MTPQWSSQSGAVQSTLPTAAGVLVVAVVATREEVNSRHSSVIILGAANLVQSSFRESTVASYWQRQLVSCRCCKREETTLLRDPGCRNLVSLVVLDIG